MSQVTTSNEVRLNENGQTNTDEITQNNT
jgi:hypothetical protein